MKLAHVPVLFACLFLSHRASAGDSDGPQRQGSKAGACEVRLSALMDAKVTSRTGEDLGKLEDLIIDPQTGMVEFAVLGRGGFLGIGEQYVPIPWKALQFTGGEEFTVNVDKKKLEAAPTTDKQCSKLHKPGYVVSIYRFFATPTREMGAAETPGGTEQGAGSSNSNGRETSNEDKPSASAPRKTTDSDAQPY